MQMRRFNGIEPENFHLFLKECGWRFNERKHKELLKQPK
jgi:transposase-like protein